MFYLEVVQAVLIFGADTWVLLAAMSQNLEGMHVGFLRKMTDQKEKRQRNGTCRSEAAAKVIKEARTHTLGAHIDKRQATLVDYVALRPILEICDRDTVYEGGGRFWELWLWQTKAKK